MSKSEQDVRRKALTHIIKTRFDANQTAFAKKAGKPQSQISDMLRRRKSFGEKVARELETRAGLERGVLDIDPDAPPENHKRDSVREAMTAYGLTITPEEAAHGREWGKLRGPVRELLQQLVDLLVAEQVREDRKPPARKPRRDGDRPRPT